MTFYMGLAIVSDIGAIFYNQSNGCSVSGDINNDNIINILANYYITYWQ